MYTHHTHNPHMHAHTTYIYTPYMHAHTPRTPHIHTPHTCTYRIYTHITYTYTHHIYTHHTGTHHIYTHHTHAHTAYTHHTGAHHILVYTHITYTHHIYTHTTHSHFLPGSPKCPLLPQSSCSEAFWVPQSAHRALFASRGRAFSPASQPRDRPALWFVLGPPRSLSPPRRTELQGTELFSP